MRATLLILKVESSHPGRAEKPGREILFRFVSFHERIRFGVERTAYGLENVFFSIATRFIDKMVHAYGCNLLGNIFLFEKKILTGGPGTINIQNYSLNCLQIDYALINAKD